MMEPQLSSLSVEAGIDCFIARNTDTINASYEVEIQKWHPTWLARLDKEDLKNKV